MESAGVCEGVKDMTDRETESKLQQEEEPVEAETKMQEERKSEEQKKAQNENGSLWKKFRWRKENFLLLLLLGVLILVAAWPMEKQSRSTKSGSTAADSTLTFLNYGGSTSTEDAREAYVVSLEHSLEELLSTMEGVGENRVMITLKPSTRNTCYSSASTMEIEGVVVCAKGAANGKVAKNISEVIQALFGLEAHKIKIAKMI